MLSIIFTLFMLCRSQPIDGNALARNAWGTCLSILLVEAPLTFPPPGATVVAALALVVLMIAGCTSAKNHQGTLRNEIYY